MSREGIRKLLGGYATDAHGGRAAGPVRSRAGRSGVVRRVGAGAALTRFAVRPGRAAQLLAALGDAPAPWHRRLAGGCGRMPWASREWPVFWRWADMWRTWRTFAPERVVWVAMEPTKVEVNGSARPSRVFDLKQARKVAPPFPVTLPPPPVIALRPPAVPLVFIRVRDSRAAAATARAPVLAAGGSNLMALEAANPGGRPAAAARGGSGGGIGGSLAFPRAAPAKLDPLVAALIQRVRSGRRTRRGGKPVRIRRRGLRAADAGERPGGRGGATEKRRPRHHQPGRLRSGRPHRRDEVGSDVAIALHRVDCAALGGAAGRPIAASRTAAPRGARRIVPRGAPPPPRWRRASPGSGTAPRWPLPAPRGCRVPPAARGRRPPGWQRPARPRWVSPRPWLPQHDAEAFLNAGQAEDVRAVVFRRQRGTGNVAQPGNHAVQTELAGQRAPRGRVGAAAHDADFEAGDRAAERRGRPQQRIHALPAVQPPHVQNRESRGSGRMHVRADAAIRPDRAAREPRPAARAGGRARARVRPNRRW